MRRKGGTARTWRLTMGDMSFMAVIMWPVDVHKVGANGCAFLPSSVRDGSSIEYEVVVDPKEWEVQPIEWLAPIAAPSAGSTKPRLMAHANGPPVDLLTYAASEAFFNIPLSALRNLAAFLKIADPGKTLFAVLTKAPCFDVLWITPTPD